MPVATARNSECGAGAEWSEQARVCSSGRWRRSRSRLLSVPLPLWLSASAACNPTRARRTASLRGGRRETKRGTQLLPAATPGRGWLYVSIYLSTLADLDTPRAEQTASLASSSSPPIARITQRTSQDVFRSSTVSAPLCLVQPPRTAARWPASAVVVLRVRLSAGAFRRRLPPPSSGFLSQDTLRAPLAARVPLRRMRLPFYVECGYT